MVPVGKRGILRLVQFGGCLKDSLQRCEKIWGKLMKDSEALVSSTVGDVASSRPEQSGRERGQPNL
jgi:hypothetical protein